MTKKKIIIATGGTGGHTFQACSLANYLIEKNYDVELTTDKTVMLCTKVVMNPEKRIQISEPTKGEFVSRSDFENIVEVKTKEMREMWRGGRSKSIRKN